jgi:ribosomal protein S18 acetylase RimI-like enzyme
MDDRPLEQHRGDVLISTDRARLDVEAVLSMLLDTHWAHSMEREVLERAIANSLCVGVYENGRLVAFARAVTDLSTYAYLTDVVVDRDHRGRGLGRWMIETLLEHPDLQRLRRIALLTRDAQWLYEPFGFTVGVSGGSTYMELRGPTPRVTSDQAPSSG